jgi:hypothetical protein
VDLESLLFDELPELLDRHVTGSSAPLYQAGNAAGSCLMR